jgi:hypothetical protein
MQANTTTVSRDRELPKRSTTQEIIARGIITMAQQQHGQQARAAGQQGAGQQGFDRNDQRPEAQRRERDAQQRQNAGYQSRQFGASPASRGRQQAQEGAGGQQYGAQQFQSMAELALRGTALLFDLQMESARNMLRTQSRTAALFGVPDCSDMFRLGDDRARRIFTASAEQMLNSARQARETVFEVQRQLGRLAEQQTIGIAEEVRDQIEQMSRHTEEGLQEIKQIAIHEADRAEDVVDYATHAQERQQGEMRLDEGRQEGPRNEAMAHPREHGSNGGGAANEAANLTAEGEGAQNEANVPHEPTPREARERNRARR